MTVRTLDDAKAHIARLGRSQRGENIVSGPPTMSRSCCSDCRSYEPRTSNDAHATCAKSETRVSWFTPVCKSFRR